MRVHIKQCHCCTIDRKQCEYRKKISKAGKGVLVGMHFTHVCSEYHTQFQPGDRVSISLYHLNIKNKLPYYDRFFENASTRWVPYEGNPVEGVISGWNTAEICRDKFFRINLDKSVILTRVKNVGTVDSPQRIEYQQEFESYIKLPKDIKLLVPNSMYENIIRGENRFKIMHLEEE